jgi:hypothetical protein
MGRLAIVLSLVAALAAGVTTVGESKAPLPGFRSPSGNIKCLYVLPSLDDTGHQLPVFLLCSVGQADYTKTIQDTCMADPGLDWHGWSLTPTGKGSIVCSGGILYSVDSFRPVYVTLLYGRSETHIGITCRSQATGVTCSNGRGHGLFVSRQSWRVW